eukprot:gene19166-22806_t
MKTSKLFFLLLFLTCAFLKVKAQKTELLPQVPFDSLEAKNMLGVGKSTIEGVAFTRQKNGYGMRILGKVLAVNTDVTLFPVTTYFTEWYNLRKKKEGKNTSVFMSNEAFRWRVVVRTDNYGRFKFYNMKPGKYFLQAMASYSIEGTRNVYTGSDRNGYGGGTDYYQQQRNEVKIEPDHIMKNFIVIFREPDGRKQQHSEEETRIHQLHWKEWFGKWSAEGKLAGGSGLSLEGAVISPSKQISSGTHQNGTEIVGGFLLLKAEDLNQAVRIALSCPIYQFGGYAEVREMQG